ncbi:hypothetical protein SAMN05444920_12230 [Nonomuraea solani]|uniref:Uncharacterized protein n=1 Tax=Nonomuraea solani TaxID=1144553 RepID=A0A1H6EXE1_9ACTN|nr:hypothetical protein [Nonomuraea solani]SEH01781.1 hypothetical protein SAMN05444920_12230 [Nonomuraea solani]
MVVASNPSFSFADGPGRRKHTVARWNTDALPSFVDWPGLIETLNHADPTATPESGWGGSSSIISSPQGVGSGLTTWQVTGIVHEFLAEGVQQHAWEVGEYADYYDALQTTGQPYDVEQQDMLATVVCPTC